MKIILDDGTEAGVSLIPYGSVLIITPTKDDALSLVKLNRSIAPLLDVFRRHNIDIVVPGSSVKWSDESVKL